MEAKSFSEENHSRKQAQAVMRPPWSL